MKIDEVQALKDLFLSIFDIQSDPKAEKLVKYYGYDTSVNPFIDYKQALRYDVPVRPLNDSVDNDVNENDDVSDIVDRDQIEPLAPKTSSKNSNNRKSLQHPLQPDWTDYFEDLNGIQ